MRAPTILAALCLVALAPTAVAAAAQVKAMGGFFDPSTIQVAPGDEITWTNEDSMPHTVTSTWDAGESFDVVLKGGESFTWTFGEEGSYDVHCRPHAYMDDESGKMVGMTMAIDVVAAASEGGGLAPAGKLGGAGVPAPAVALVIVALLGATMLLRRRRT